MYRSVVINSFWHLGADCTNHNYPAIGLLKFSCHLTPYFNRQLAKNAESHRWSMTSLGVRPPVDRLTNAEVSDTSAGHLGHLRQSLDSIIRDDFPRALAWLSAIFHYWPEIGRLRLCLTNSTSRVPRDSLFGHPTAVCLLHQFAAHSFRYVRKQSKMAVRPMRWGYDFLIDVARKMFLSMAPLAGQSRINEVAELYFTFPSLPSLVLFLPPFHMFPFPSYPSFSLPFPSP